MIRIDLASLEAGDKRIIGNVCIVADGRRVLITGDVGSGKTLLARAICGDFRDSDWIKVAGEVELGGDVYHLPAKASALPRIGYLPQNSTNFFIASRVIDEVATTQYCSSVSTWEARSNIVAWTGGSLVRDRASLSPLALSGGQQRLFALEVVLGTSPDHLVIDGGMIALDRMFRNRATDMVETWLAANPKRTVVCFGTPADRSWLEVDCECALPPSSDNRMDHLAKAVPQSSVRTSNVEALSFHHIVAGPTISGQPLLNDVSLVVHEGQFIALTGANGIGKSTLLRLVAGVSKPQKGDVKFFGKQLTKMRWRGLRGGIGYLPQEPELAGPTAIDIRERPDKNDLRYWEDFFGFKWFKDSSRYWTLSSGERARATLFFQAAFRPRVWLLDEPTSRISSSETARFLSALRTFDSKVSAILVSHDERLIELVADSKFELTKDGIRAVGTNA